MGSGVGAQHQSSCLRLLDGSAGCRRCIRLFGMHVHKFFVDQAMRGATHERAETHQDRDGCQVGQVGEPRGALQGKAIDHDYAQGGIDQTCQPPAQAGDS